MLEIKRFYTNSSATSRSSIRRRLATCRLVNANDEVVFEALEVEVPEEWSDVAAAIAASRYLSMGDKYGSRLENSVFQMVSRVVGWITDRGIQGGYFNSPSGAEIFKSELAHILLRQCAAFNTPVWLNVGTSEQPLCSACFILGVEDLIESLLELQNIEGRVFRQGAGIGCNLTTIRSRSEEPLAGGDFGGPVYLMEAYDTWAKVVQSSGRNRRAARMQLLDCNHPDIVDFITSKMLPTARARAIASLPSLHGSLGMKELQLRNTNLCVRVTDEFMQAVVNNRAIDLRRVSDGAIASQVAANELLELIARAIESCGEPGLHFVDTINSWHTVPSAGPIRGSNPCSEFVFVDDSACNLASINLCRYLNPRGGFDIEAFMHTVGILVIAQNILVDCSAYPSERIRENSLKLRPIGVGFTNLGGLLMQMGVPYDSDAGRSIASGIAAVMTGQGYYQSAVIAARFGPFDKFGDNRASMMRVLNKHRDALYRAPNSGLASELHCRALEIWDEALKLGGRYGFRNAQISLIAPTGTTSLLMDCDTSGIEPEIALKKARTLHGGAVLPLRNQSIFKALRRRGYPDSIVDDVASHIERYGGLDDFKGIHPEDLAIFDTAIPARPGGRCISARGQIKMLAAVQPFISGAISKTVLLPSGAHWPEILDWIIMAWRAQLKSVSLYRYDSKDHQPIGSGSLSSNVVASKTGK